LVRLSAAHWVDSKQEKKMVTDNVEEVPIILGTNPSQDAQKGTNLSEVTKKESDLSEATKKGIDLSEAAKKGTDL
jgi:hypothetical protein